MGDVEWKRSEPGGAWGMSSGSAVNLGHGECCAGSVFKYDPDEAIAVRCGRTAKEIKDSAMDTFTCVAA